MSVCLSKLGFVLLGKTGAGKSCFGNFLLRKKAFISSSNASSVSKQPKSVSSNLGSILVTVVDNPGLFSDDLPMLSTASIIQDSIEMVGHDNFVFLLVIRLGRFTVEDSDTMDFLTIMFGQNFMQHSILIFTHDDQAVYEDQTIENVIREFVSMPKRKELFDRCSQMYLSVNCREPNIDIKEIKWKQLLQMVVKITESGQKFYRKDYLQAYKDGIRTHARCWTDNRLTYNQMQIIMKTQDDLKQTQIENLRREKEEKDRKIKEQEKKIETMKIAIGVAAAAGATFAGGGTLIASVSGSAALRATFEEGAAIGAAVAPALHTAAGPIFGAITTALGAAVTRDSGPVVGHGACGHGLFFPGNR